MIWICIGAAFMFLGVGLGAFGAHALAKMVSENLIAVFKTGVMYHMIHALGLIAYGLTKFESNVPGWCFTIGIVLFSGSLYALVLSGISKLGMITPIGGVLFLIGWAAFAFAAWKRL